MDECEDCTLYLIIFIFCILAQAKFVLVLIFADGYYWATFSLARHPHFEKTNSEKSTLLLVWL